MNVLNLFQADGTTVLPIEFRGGVPQPKMEIDLVYGDEGGSGVSEYVVRNISSDSNAKQVRVSTGTPPLDPDLGGALIQEWAWKAQDEDEWSVYASEVIIPTIPAGETIRLRTKVTAAANSNPSTHKGNVVINYLRSSV